MPSGTLADELGTTDRTLRRLAATGVVTPGFRKSGRKPLPAKEEDWLRQHWTVLSDLRLALRSEPRVRAAILFGSVAKGTETASSDLDLIVDLDSQDPLVLRQFRSRLAGKLNRPLDLFLLTDLEAEPETLAPILDHARPVVDRGGVWSRLGQRRRTLQAQARRRTAARRFGSS